jgi:hypothetical protein
MNPVVLQFSSSDSTLQWYGAMLLLQSCASRVREGRGGKSCINVGLTTAEAGTCLQLLIESGQSQSWPCIAVGLGRILGSRGSRLHNAVLDSIVDRSCRGMSCIWYVLHLRITYTVQNNTNMMDWDVCWTSSCGSTPVRKETFVSALATGVLGKR